MLHLDHSHELICKPKLGLQSKAMGQVLLPPVGGGPFWYPRKEGAERALYGQRVVY